MTSKGAALKHCIAAIMGVRQRTSMAAEEEIARGQFSPAVWLRPAARLPCCSRLLLPTLLSELWADLREKDNLYAIPGRIDPALAKEG